MNTYVPKPVRPEVLQAALEQFSAQNAGSSAPSAGTDSPTPMPTAVPDNQAPVDVERLMEFSGGRVESFTELVDLYLKQTTQQLAQIRTALAENDAPRVASVAHSCAGASATCGMSGILPLLRQLERIAMEADLVASGQLLQSIDAEFERIKTFLAQSPKLLFAA